MTNHITTIATIKTLTHYQIFQYPGGNAIKSVPIKGGGVFTDTAQFFVYEKNRYDDNYESNIVFPLAWFQDEILKVVGTTIIEYKYPSEAEMNLATEAAEAASQPDEEAATKCSPKKVCDDPIIPMPTFLVRVRKFFERLFGG